MALKGFTLSRGRRKERTSPATETQNEMRQNKGMSPEEKK
jgi:hypothetical protein